MFRMLAMKVLSSDTYYKGTLYFAKESKEMDINPLIADSRGIFAVDARIRIEKQAVSDKDNKNE